MIPDPLHPAIVHFPIALVSLLPVAAALAFVAIRRGAAPRPTWGWVVAWSGALLVFAWLALQTGKVQEDVVERVVGEAALHEHEESAETFLLLSLAGVLVFAAGLAPGRLGSTSRIAGLVAGVALLAAGVRVGHSGGSLVYQHGAAQAYVEGAAGLSSTPDRTQTRDDDEDERREDDNRSRRRSR